MKKLILFGLTLAMSCNSVQGFWGCSKSSRLHHGMSRSEVSLALGQPDIMSPAALDRKGNMVDVWAYDFIARDYQFAARFILFLVLLPISIILWPFFLISDHKEGIEWTSKTLFLKFENDVLCKWGSIVDIIDAKK